MKLFVPTCVCSRPDGLRNEGRSVDDIEFKAVDTSLSKKL